MTYETAKKLKDAKFPFTWDYEPQALAFRQYPTLSELIEACNNDLKGGGFDLLQQIFDDEWKADCEFVTGQAKGATPEEAVANLWLALNEKKTLDKTPPNKV